MNSIFAAIIAHVSYAVGDNISVFANRKIGFRKTTFWSWVGGIPVALFGIPFFWHGAVSITPGSIFETAGLTVLLVVTFFAFNASLERANVVLAGTIAGTFPALVVLLSLWWFGEVLRRTQVVLLAVIFIGMLLATIPISMIRKHQFRMERNLWYAVATFFGWGIYFTLIRLPIEIQGWFLTNTLVTLFGFLMIGIVFLLRRWSPGRPTYRWRNGYVSAMLAVAITTAGTYAFSYAIEHGRSSIVAPIAGSYPALYAILAYFLYRDRLERSQIVGAVLTFTGVTFLSFLSG